LEILEDRVVPASFQGLGFNGPFGGWPSLSADGSTVLDGNVLWTPGNGQILGAPTIFMGTGLSSNGTVLSVAVNGVLPYRWTQQTGLQPIPLIPPNDVLGESGPVSIPLFISGDGNTITGLDALAGIFRWTPSGTSLLIPAQGTLSGVTYYSIASLIGASSDGNHMVGELAPQLFNGSPFGGDLFRWDNGLLSVLPADTGSDGYSATAISPDGSVVVGTEFTNLQEPSEADQDFMWGPTGVQTFGPVFNAQQSLAPFASSNAGTTIVGDESGFSASPHDVVAMIWDATNGVRVLQDVLTTQYGLGSALAGWQLTAASGITPDGNTIVGIGTDPQGNAEDWIARLVNTSLPTQTILTAAPSPSKFGQPVTFTATVAPVAPTGVIPMGTVTFMDGTNSLGSATLDGMGVATLPTSSIALGDHPAVTAVYSGDSTFSGSTSSPIDLLNQASTMTTIVASTQLSTYGDPVTFTASVSAPALGGIGPTGTVDFFEEGPHTKLNSQPVPLDGGVASFTTTGLPGHNFDFVDAVYNPDSQNFSTSTSTLVGVAVLPRKLNIAPTPGQSKAYGASVPTNLAYTPTGLANNDNASIITGALTTTAAANSPVGKYLFTLGTLTVGENYTLVLAANPPYFTVVPAILTVSANPASRIYGTANPPLSVTYFGFVNGENAITSGLTGMPILSTSATPTSKPGTYTIKARRGTLSAPNYAFALVDGKLTVKPAPLSAVGVSFSAIAGAPFAGTVATFINADPFGSAASYAASINWGDGVTSSGIITPAGNAFSVIGSHIYADPVNHSVTVRISHVFGFTTSVTVSDVATVTSLGLPVGPGLTGNIQFWNSASGQSLITSFNGDPASTVLSSWLATTFPRLYGASAGLHNLANETNSQVAALFQAVYSLPSPQPDAQVLAVALNIYATTNSLGGAQGSGYGFAVSDTGLGALSYDVGKDGAAFGAKNYSTLTVFHLLLAANRKAVNGVLYNGDTALQAEAADLFSSLNQDGSIL